MSGTLIYSPGVAIVIESASDGAIDVSDDASAGSVSLRENGSHSVQITLENPNRKYDGLFTPNDRVIIQMKRFRWMQVFCGYIDSAPYFSAYARQVTITAQCPLKALKYWPWDRGSQQAYNLLFAKRDTEAQDGGLAEVVVRVMTTVTNWTKDRIHIGRVPEEWMLKYAQVYSRVDQETTKALETIIGVNPLINGEAVGALPATTVGRGNMPTVGTNVQFESMIILPADYDVAMATIRTIESGGDYTATNKGDGKGDWATGAYQFMDTTWGNFKGYARASQAPPEVQDEKAMGLLRWIISHAGNKLVNIPRGWYYPISLTDPTWLDKPPKDLTTGDEGNQFTVRQYSYKWAQTYITIYKQMRNGVSPAPGEQTVLSSSYDVETGATTTRLGVTYPIPEGKSQLSYVDCAWGGWENGKIPASALASSPRTLQGHPLAVQSWNELCDEAEKVGYDFRGGMYRSYESQVALSGGAGVKVAGTSNHGWGLAIDINVLLGNYSKKYPKKSNDYMYDTPEYIWLWNNAPKFGWLHPPWGQRTGHKPEAWHWEFVAFYSYKDGTGNPLTEGVNPYSDTNDETLGDFSNPSAKQLFAVLAGWLQDPNDVDLQSESLWGYRALMNDEPIMVTIDQLIRATGRSYCCAPNGDFIAWFPDYWGEYGVAGAMDIEEIELKDFSVDWSDASLVTHQFVEGATFTFSTGPLPSGIMDAYQAFMTRGIVTVDMPGVLESVMGSKDNSRFPWLKEPDKLLQRFGARIDRNQNPVIYGPEAEFWMAVSRFTRSWAGMFTASAPLTFMPELFPGMLMRIPFFKVQMYVTSVTHSWDYRNDVGFSTNVQTMAVSTTETGGGLYLFPKGGDILLPDDNGDPVPVSKYKVMRS